MATERVDPWEAANRPSYTRNKFYTRSRDQFGATENQQIKFSPNTLGAISAIIASKQIPDYRTSSDFVRDAVIHRLKDVMAMQADGSLDYLQEQVDEECLASEVAKIKTRRVTREQLIAGFESGLKNAWDGQDMPTVMELLTLLEDALPTLPPPFYGMGSQLLSHYYKIANIGALKPWKDHPLAAIEMPAIGDGGGE